jgi:hypothetical protein
LDLPLNDGSASDVLAIKAAEDCGLIFCVEVVNRFEQFIMNTAAEGIALLNGSGVPIAKFFSIRFI